MKIAVAAEDNNISTNVSYYGGRAPFYLIFDEHGDLMDSFANPFEEMDRHAGYEVSMLMAEEGVDAVIAGLFGPTMLSELSSRGIKCITKSGRARDAVLALDLSNDT